MCSVLSIGLGVLAAAIGLVIGGSAGVFLWAVFK